MERNYYATQQAIAPRWSRRRRKDGFETMRGLMIGLALSQMMWIIIGLLVF